MNDMHNDLRTLDIPMQRCVWDSVECPEYVGHNIVANRNCRISFDISAFALASFALEVVETVQDAHPRA